MLRIYFNIAAFFQVLIIIGVYICYGLIDDYVLHVTTNVSGDYIGAVFLQAAAFICVWTDVKGLHGRLFFLPTWLICILGSLFFGELIYDFKTLKFLLWCSSALVIFCYIYKMPAYLKKQWLKRQEAGEKLKAALLTGPVSDKNFWAIASHMYYKPSLLFLLQHPIWIFIFRNAIDEQAFIEHYRLMMNNMPIGDIQGSEFQRSRYKRWMTEFKRQMNTTIHLTDYQVSVFSFTRLGNVINDMNNILGR